MPIELWSFEKDSESSGVGFVCVHDVMNSVLYAKLTCAPGQEAGTAANRCTKGAISALLDLAEVCTTFKIAIGLSPDHASCADLVCALLYLSFQVVPTRKCPLVDAALLLEFELGAPVPPGNYNLSSGNTCSGTSECSTSAEENGRCDSELLDSD